MIRKIFGAHDLSRQPLIGLVPLWDEERQSLWMLPGYAEGISRAGGTPFVLPLTNDESQLEQLALLVDGLVFTGGQDVSPTMYGAARNPLCGLPCPMRDTMESALFRLVVERLDKPALGICRGLQFFNVYLGGDLHQDLAAELNAEKPLNHQQKPPYDRPGHSIQISEGSPLQELLGLSELAVNSSHHQGIRNLAPDLEVMAQSPDGLVEAVCLPDRSFAWAVQWHPELCLKERHSQLLFSSLVDAARRLKASKVSSGRSIIRNRSLMNTGEIFRGC